MFTGPIGRLLLAAILLLTRAAHAQSNPVALTYQSVFVGYRAFAVSVPDSWRAVNEHPAPPSSGAPPPVSATAAPVDPHAAHRGHQ